MAQTDARTLQELKQDTERTRAGLTDTVDQLRSTVSETASDFRQRISPENIKAEVSDYFRTRGEELLDTVTSAARRNPMQAVAIGASVAYPLLRLARSIPVPVLMVGAGLFLAGSKTGQSMTQKASDAASDLADVLGRQTQNVKRNIDDTVSTAKDYASERISGLTNAAAAGTETLKQKATSVGASLSTTAEDVRRQAVAAGNSAMATASDRQTRTLAAAGSMADSASDIASGAAAAVRDTVDASVDTVRDAVGTLRQRSTEFSDRAGKTFLEAIEQNPLIVGGIGLLIGGLIASALPRSDVEDGFIGNVSTNVKSRVRDAASKGMASATDIAGSVYDDVARHAERQGLTPDRLTNVTADLGQRVRKVAEAAVTAAFEPPSTENHQQVVEGGTGHG